MGNDQCGLIQLLDDIRHGEGLSGACDTEKRLELIALLKTSYEVFDGFRLVAGGLVFGM